MPLLRAFVASALVAAPLVVLAPVPSPASAAAATTPRVTWTDRSVVAGRAMTATVSVDSLADGTTPVLQRKFPDVPWRVADDTPRATAAGLVLDVPTDQYGTFSYRVVALDGSAVVAATDPVKVSVTTSYDPAGRASQHAFMTDPRWMWDSCGGPITWKFNPDLAPAGALSQVKDAFDRIHAATGLDFSYEGTSDVTPKASDPGSSGADILLGWRSSSAFERPSTTVGLGGAAFYRGYRLANGSTVSKAVEGGVALNAGFNDDLGSGFGRGYTWGDVLMHELAHVIGLDHVGARSQVMYGSITAGAARWGAGDLNGFRKVGDTFGCLRATARARGALQTATSH